MHLEQLRHHLESLDDSRPFLHGWKVRDVRLPPPPAGQDARLLAPAEVELS